MNDQTLGLVCVGLAAGSLLTTLALVLYNLGFHNGYARGRVEADQWWFTMDAGATEARTEIWREE